MAVTKTNIQIYFLKEFSRYLEEIIRFLHATRQTSQWKQTADTNSKFYNTVRPKHEITQLKLSVKVCRSLWRNLHKNSE
jgi:hypothetical protein